MISSSRRMELVFWSCLPAIITLLLTLLYLMAKHISGLDRFMPVLPLAPIFYWGMMHAREMPYWFAFVIGLLMDAVTGLPLGLTSLLYIFFLSLLHAQRKYIHKEGFVIKWGYFAVLLAVIDSLNWIILSLFHSTSLNLMPAGIQWLFTTCFYPVLHQGFDRLNDHMHARRWKVLHGL